MDKHHFYGFKDALYRGRGTRTEIIFKDQDLEDRLDWELTNRSQS